MKVAVIENRLKDYVISVFNQHSDLKIELASFLDWRPQQEQYQGIPIKKIEELNTDQYDAILLAIKENRYLSRLLTYLHKNCIENVYIVRLFTMDMEEDFIEDGQVSYFDCACVDRMPGEHEKPYLVHLETHVCDHCNLNCKACNNFSPFVKEPSYTDIDQFERDLIRLTELFSGIGRFFLLGGEPMLAPELCCDMIRCFRRYFPTNELRVLTNATLILSMKDWFWDSIRENEVIIHISLYPPVKGKIHEIKERLDSKKIRYIVFKEVDTFAKHWTVYPFEDEQYNNEHCGSSGCHYLRNGEIAKCPDAILVDFMASGKDSLSNLGFNERENLLQISNAWELLEKLDNPIDLCKKCTYKRIKRTKWECVEKDAEPSDWLLPHRYEYEVEKLKSDNEKANHEIEALKKKVREQDKRIEKQYNDFDIVLKQAQQEYERISNSYSYKIGRLITWIPRKMRRRIKGIIGGIKKKAEQSGVYKINSIFKNDVLKGFDEYKRIVNEYGSDVVIFSTAWRGTGDYYICGLYLGEYLKINNIKNYVFLIPLNGGERKVVELFQVYDSHTLEVENTIALRGFNSFIPEKVVLHYLHHGFSNLKNPSITVSNAIETGSMLTGYNGLNMVDFYLYCGFKLPENANKSLPRFILAEDYIDELFQKNNLKKGKTVLISPHSTGLKQYEIPEAFWTHLILVLKMKGYSLAINCTSMEKGIAGAPTLCVPYNQIVPFLEKAGYFIGIRSGLCDIISAAKCVKIVLHIYEAKWWRDGQSVQYTGLNNMGLCDDAIEYNYKKETEQLLMEDIINNIVKEDCKNKFYCDSRCN